MMKQCEKGHLYDDSKNKICPYCSGKITSTIKPSENLNDLICEKCGKIYSGEQTIPVCCWECGGELQGIGKKRGYERCCNCLEWIEEGEYCIYCGAKKGEGKYNLKAKSTDYEGRCGNCHKLLGDDKYCRYCGTKKGEGAFKPYENFFPCLYGSPITYIHKCKKCGTEFQSSGMEDRPNYCYKCGNSVTCEEENNSYANIQELQRSPHDNEFVTIDDFGNATQRSLNENITLYTFFGGRCLIGGGYANGEVHTLEYDAKRRIVEEKKTGYFEAEKGNAIVENSLVIPDNILFENDLIKHIKSNKPEWSVLLDKDKPKKAKFDPSPLAGIPAYQPPKGFEPKDNIMPCVYGSPEQMSGIYGKKKAKKQKKWLFGLLLALGVSVCIVLLILILLNL